MSESHPPQPPHPPHPAQPHPAQQHPAQPQAPKPPGLAKIAAVPTMAAPAKTLNDEPLALVDEPAVAPGASKIRAFSVAGGHQHNYKFQRQTTVTGRGAIRVRTFHGRLSDEGMAHMDDKINEWIDQHADIEVKFVSTSIGTFEGKIREPALVVNIWY